jgi:prevent-host-death family protein
MMSVNMLEAKTQLSKLVDRALNGEEVIIARDGEPQVRLVPVKQKMLRPIGLYSSVGLSQQSLKESISPPSEKELEAWNG